MKELGGEEAAAKMDDLIAKSDGSQQAALASLHTHRFGQNNRSFASFLADQDDLDELSRYTLVLREIGRRQNGEAPKLDLLDEELVRAYQYGKDKGLDDAAVELEEYFRSLVDMQHKNGLISDEQLEAIIESEDYYTPFIARYEKGVRTPDGASGEAFSSGSNVRRMERDVASETAKIDPIEVAVTETFRVHDNVAKKRMFDYMQEFADDDGNIPGVIRKIKGEKQPGARVIQAVGPDGKTARYAVEDEDLYNAMVQMDPLSNNAFLRLTRGIARIKRQGIVGLPDFALFAGLRDLPVYAMQGSARQAVSEGATGAVAGAAIGGATAEDGDAVGGALRGAGFGLAGGALARPAIEILGAMKNIIGDDEIYNHWLREGGSTEGFNVRDPKSLSKVMERLTQTERNDVLQFENFTDVLNLVGSVVEQAPRLAATKRYLKNQGYELRNVDLEAGFRPPQYIMDRGVRLGQDVSVRFSSKGGNPIVRETAANTPFWNATVQGYEKTARLLDPRNPTPALLGAGIITAPTVALWSINKDNPEYWDRPEWERNIFWMIPKGGDDGGFYRIPKPFEVGLVFASLPERLLDYAAQQGKIPSAAPEGGSLRSTTGRFAASGFGSFAGGAAPIPTAVEIPLSQATNTDMFRWRDVVPLGYDNLSPEMQYNQRTSGVARALGSGIESVVGETPLLKEAASPMRIEKAIYDLLGTAGRRALAVGDLGLEATTDLPTPMDRKTPAEIAATVSGVDRFNARDYSMGQLEYEARGAMDQYEEKYNDFLKLQRENATDEDLRAFLEKDNNAHLVKSWRPTNDKLVELGYGDEEAGDSGLPELRRQLDKLNRTRNTVERDEQMSEQERRERLNALKQIGNELSKRILDITRGGQ